MQNLIYPQFISSQCIFVQLEHTQDSAADGPNIAPCHVNYIF